MYLYSPTIIETGIAVGTAKIAQISFGLSISSIAAMAASQISDTCSQDWIEVNSKSNFKFMGIALIPSIPVILKSPHSYLHCNICREFDFTGILWGFPALDVGNHVIT